MPYTIISIDDDINFLTTLRLRFKKKYNFLTTISLAEGLQEIKCKDVDLVLLDISLSGGENGLDGIRQIKQLSPETDVVMVTGSKDPKTVIQAIRAGALDYLCKPFDDNELTAIIEKHISLKDIRDKKNALIEELNPIDTRSRILGTSITFRTLMERAGRVKGHKANILVLGESGTGKELLARYIHSLEENSRRPFIAVNCAAIPEGLIESELFGHERGAFTCAHHRKIGKFELANGGDIFLDEISCLKPALQAKILRVLQEKEIVRVGANSPIPVDFRVISASNENLDDKVAKNEFRVDLYHRLRVVELQIPPLRERRGDIPLLIAYFLDKFGRKNGPKRISAEALRRLQEYSWPGNVRELENIIHSVTILSPGDTITCEHLPRWAKDPTGEAIVNQNHSPGKTLILPQKLASVPYKDFVRRAEKIYIQHALEENHGDKTRTAEQLKMGRTTLYGKLRELDLLN